MNSFTVVFEFTVHELTSERCVGKEQNRREFAVSKMDLVKKRGVANPCLGFNLVI